MMPIESNTVALGESLKIDESVNNISHVAFGFSGHSIYWCICWRCYSLSLLCFAILRTTLIEAQFENRFCLSRVNDGNRWENENNRKLWLVWLLRWIEKIAHRHRINTCDVQILRLVLRRWRREKHLDLYVRHFLLRAQLCTERLHLVASLQKPPRKELGERKTKNVERYASLSMTRKPIAEWWMPSKWQCKRKWTRLSIWAFVSDNNNFR